MNVYGQNVKVQLPVTSSTKVEIYGYNSVMFVNKGNTDVVINKFFTLAPGEAFPFGNSGIVEGYVKTKHVDFRFDTTEQTDSNGDPIPLVNKIEWVTTKYDNINIPPCRN